MYIFVIHIIRYPYVIFAWVRDIVTVCSLGNDNAEESCVVLHVLVRERLWNMIFSDSRMRKWNMLWGKKDLDGSIKITNYEIHQWGHS